MKMIFDFDKNVDVSGWYILEDQVMGGKSTGEFYVNEEGHGLFKGHVSLENNGGFSSVHYNHPKIDVSDLNTISIRLKGDGKNYQFRVKDDDKHEYSYVAEFETSGEWQKVKIALNDMVPTFRGRKLDMPNFDKPNIDEIAILIGNKRNEDFEILIDKIELE